jgi:hypothetical protein
MMFSLKSLFSILVVLVVAMQSSADAKILDVICGLFDAPNRIDSFAGAPGHCAEKTVEFLAFGDAGTGYYQS